MTTGERIQRHITEFWDLVAPHYEDHPGNTVAPTSPDYRAWIDVFRDALPGDQSDVLDLGTGTGFAALIIAALGHRVVGMDLARNMLSVARSRATIRASDVRFVVGDAVSPPFDDGSFDVIASRHLLWTLRDATVALRRWHRILRPGGRVIAFDSLRRWNEPTIEPSEDDVFGKHYTLPVQSVLAFMRSTDHAAQIDAFTAAGFTRVRVEELPESFAQDDPGASPYRLIAER
jgi:ubiquinone/menaquinone biosynthesis C-methylase UbiE